ncbi:UNVERIFIED_ORG: hypothetical protein ABIC54_003016 [Burkholderia sp. 1263]
MAEPMKPQKRWSMRLPLAVRGLEAGIGGGLNRSVPAVRSVAVDQETMADAMNDAMPIGIRKIVDSLIRFIHLVLAASHDPRARRG